MKVIVIAAHAPHRGAAEQEIEHFWANLSGAIPKTFEHWRRILLTDANAHVGSLPTDAVGAFQAEQEDDKSAYFHRFLVEQGLWLPSTFPEHQIGEGGTWWNGRTKQWQGNDYIGIANTWTGTCYTQINDKIDLSICKDDHRVAQLRYVDYVPLGNSRAKHMKRWQPEALAQWAQQLTSTSFPDIEAWNLDVHMHAQVLENTFADQINNNVPKQGRIKRKTHLSDDTWKSILSKRHCRKHLAEANGHARSTMLRVVFLAWSGYKDGKATFDVECGQAELLRELDWLVARALHSFRVSGRRVTALVRKDDNNYYQEMAHRAGECDRQSGLQQLLKCIKGGLPKHKARRRNDNPMTCVNLDAQWHPYFKNLELGKEIDSTALRNN